MTDQDNIVKLKREMAQVVTAVGQITGLNSNWNGELEVVPKDANYLGMKPFACSIRLRADTVEAEDRWRTLLHEAFHAASAGYSAKAFLENIGWEEGLVEKLQRLFRARILTNLHVTVEENLENLFVSGDDQHAFNRYVHALEKLQPLFAPEEDQFYLMLIRTPLQERYRTLLQRAMQYEGLVRKDTLGALSAANAILKESLHELS